MKPREPVEGLVLDHGGPRLLVSAGEESDPCRDVLWKTTFCTNPECRLAHVVVATSAQPWVTMIEFESAPKTSLSADVNVDTGEILMRGSTGDDRATEGLSERLKRHTRTRPAFLAVLRRRMRRARGLGMDRWRGRDWSWWTPGTLVAWRDGFADDPDWLFSLAGESFFADDSYCITPGCRCADACLAFYSAEGGSPLTAMWVDVRTWRARSYVDDRPLKEEQQNLWSALQASVEDLQQEISRRHRVLRRLGPEIERLSGHDTSRRGEATSVVGRNDPCPCGSGRKYKKCCLCR